MPWKWPPEFQLQLVARYDLEGLELDARAAGIEAEKMTTPARASRLDHDLQAPA
jgi:hypothetical protein